MELRRQYFITMANVKFCPFCGQEVDGSSKFCPKCGKALNKASKQSSSSGLMGNIMGAVNKVSQTAVDMTNKVKDTYNEKEASSKRVAKVSMLDSETNKEEQIIAELDGLYGTGLIKNPVKLVLTNKSIMLNGSKTELIKLSTIKEIQKVNNPIDKSITYTIITSTKEYPIVIKKKPYNFISKLSTVLKIDGNLYGIDLLEGEEILGIYDGSIKNKFQSTKGTLYQTNMRIVFAKIPTFADSGEGTEIVYDFPKDKITCIKENKGKLSCYYSIMTSNECFEFTFVGLVPQSFLSLVPGAEGNKDILERIKKFKTALKIIGAIAAIFGASGLADDDDDDDMDDEVEDDDMDDEVDGVEADLDGDGDADAVGLDTDGDGQIDTVGVDADGDGAIDTVAMDTDDDGQVDTMAVDANGDGQVDAVGVDTDGDGVIDSEMTSENAQAGAGAEPMSAEEIHQQNVKEYNSLGSQKMQLENKLMSTADPNERAAINRELDMLNRRGDELFDKVFMHK